MNRSQPTKGERTRERLFTAAVARFEFEGYETASMRRIAADAGVTPALLYRYFASKEAIVAELYGRSIRAWGEQSRNLPRGTWIDRTLWLTRLAFEVLAPYRELLRVLAGSMLEGDPSTSPVHNEVSRSVSMPMFERVVAEATDAQKDVLAYRDLAYSAHLALILFWVVDQTPERQATEQLLDQVTAMAPLLKLGLKMPVVGPQLRNLGGTVMSALRGEMPS